MSNSSKGQGRGEAVQNIMAYAALLVLLLAIIASFMANGLFGLSSITLYLGATGFAIFAKEGGGGNGRPPDRCPPYCYRPFFYVGCLAFLCAAIAAFSQGVFLTVSALEWFMIVVVMGILKEGGGKGGQPTPPPLPGG